MSHTVFISYSSKDKKMANAICHYLEHEKIKCWIAPRDVALGKNFANEIVKAIPESKVMVIVLSGNSNESKYVMRELELAVQNDLLVIPVRIEDIIPTGAMAFYLSTMEWIDIIDTTTNDNLSRLTHTIKKIVGVITENDETPADDAISKTPIETAVRQTPPKKPPRQKQGKNVTVNIKKLLIACAVFVLVVAAGLTVFFMRDTLFKPDEPIETETTNTSIKKEDEATPTPAPATPIPTEVPDPTFVPADFGLDANAPVEIEDASLKEAVYTTFLDSGVMQEGEVLTVAQMFELEKLYIQVETEEENTEINMYTDYALTVEEGITTLNGLEYARNLRELWVIGSDRLTDIAAVSHLNQLELLVLEGTKIEDIAPLANLYNLKHLRVTWNYVKDLEPIRGLTKLEEFHFAPYEKGVENLDAIYGYKNLKVLALANVKLDDLSFLTSYSNLDFLRLDICELGDITPISELSNLTFLIMEGSDVGDLSPIKDMDLNRLWLDKKTYNDNIDTVNALIAKGCEVTARGE